MLQWYICLRNSLTVGSYCDNFSLRIHCYHFKHIVFFEESSISFIFSPLGWGYILFLQLLVLLLGWVISRVLRISRIKIEIYYLNKFARLTMIGGLIIWLGLLFWAIKTSWQPSLIMISGLALFTVIISYSKLKSSGKA